MQKKWKLREVPEESLRMIDDGLQLPEALIKALGMRGFTEEREIDSFLNPRLSDLSDPYLLPDMEKAAERIWAAIDSAERITVFGDYDVDGVTSAAIMTRALQALGGAVFPFIPDRLDEGYGLSEDAVARCLAEHRSTLLVSVDCGVNSVESVAYAQSKGCDVIVTDHHEPDEKTAPAFAVINPKLGKVESLKILSGAGVAFKLCHGILKFGRDHGKTAADDVDLRDYLDIAALGTVADIVPLLEENRILVRHGRTRLNATKWEGMRALKDVSGIRNDVDTYHLGFQLGPRINAAGRIGQPMEALRLLVTDDAGEARHIAGVLNKTNEDRRRIEQEMANMAFSQIDDTFNPEKDYGLVVAEKEWHPGVVGIVASRVSRHYNRPAIVLGIDDDGNARGSCRSIGGFNLLEGLRRCDGLLTKYGGHKMAAGVELPAGQLEEFREAFNRSATEDLKGADLSPVQQIDAELSPGELDWRFYDALRKLGPFGQDNSEPVWAMMNVTVAGAPRVVGQKHLKLVLACEGERYEAIAFNYPEENVPSGNIDVAFTLKENRWNGNTRLQLQVQDIRPAQKL
jgi:single-stranded-DNA-specific exonuclease